MRLGSAENKPEARPSKALARGSSLPTRVRRANARSARARRVAPLGSSQPRSASRCSVARPPGDVAACDTSPGACARAQRTRGPVNTRERCGRIRWHAAAQPERAQVKQQAMRGRSRTCAPGVAALTLVQHVKQPHRARTAAERVQRPDRVSCTDDACAASVSAPARSRRALRTWRQAPSAGHCPVPKRRLHGRAMLQRRC
jgi:hypothetical protein